MNTWPEHDLVIAVPAAILPADQFRQLALGTQDALFTPELRGLTVIFFSATASPKAPLSQASFCQLNGQSLALLTPTLRGGPVVPGAAQVLAELRRRNIGYQILKAPAGYR